MVNESIPITYRIFNDLKHEIEENYYKELDK